MIFILPATFVQLFVGGNATKAMRRKAAVLPSVAAVVVGLFNVLSVQQSFTQILPAPAAAADSVRAVRNRTEIFDVRDPLAAEAPVALVSNVLLDVTRKEAFKEWQIARRGDVLSSGDRVKTGMESFAVIRFKDHSLVRLRERSDLTVTGRAEGSSLTTSVDVHTGAVGFNINTQRQDERFRFTSPTSVASIRGTEGRFVSNPLSDTLTIIEGAVLLTNLLSSEYAEVRAGFTGISHSDGRISVRMATPGELSAACSEATRDIETRQTVLAHRTRCLVGGQFRAFALSTGMEFRLTQKPVHSRIRGPLFSRARTHGVPVIVRTQ
jgi:hypothetical protein